MRDFDIFRVEQFVIHPHGRDTVHDIQSAINKTQDLHVKSVEVMENKHDFLFTVHRELEWFPDTIK